MHRRTKKILLGTAGLAVTLAPGILTSTQPILSQGLLTVAAAEEVGNVTTKVRVDNYAYSRVNWTLSGTVSGRVKAGDTVTYILNNWDPRDWTPTAVKTKDGIEIGTVEIDKSKLTNNAYSARFDSLDAIPEAAKKLEPGGSRGVRLIIRFNDKAAELENISFEIGGKGNWNPISSTKSAHQVRQTVEQGGKTVFEQTVTYDPARVATPQKVNSLVFNGSARVDLVNNKVNAVFGNITVHQAGNDGDTPGLKKGDRITASLAPDSAILWDTSKLKVGETLHGDHDRYIFPNSRTNDHDVYLQDYNKESYKIVEATPTKLVLEATNDARTRDGLQTYPYAILKDPKSFDFSKPIAPNTQKGRLTWTRGQEVLFDKDQIGEMRVSGSLTGGSGVIVPKHSVTVRYQDESGTELSPAEKVLDNQEVGTRKTLTPKSISGYEFVKSSAGLDLIVGSQDSEVILTYRKPATAPEDEEIVTSFLEEGSGEKLKEPVKAEKEAEPGTIEGYQFVRTERKGNEVTHWFKKKEEPKKPETKQPNTRYVDEDGKVIEEVPGSQDKKEIPDYTYLRTEKDKDGNITHIYHKIVTRFVTDKGMTLKQMDGAQPKEEIDGYEFVETKTDEKTGDVTHVYREVTPTAEPLTILKDDKGNVLKTTKGTHDPEDLPGYRYLRTEKDKDGNTVHIYHRIVTSFVTVKDGKEVVLKAKDGAQPKEDINGYEFIETKTDQKTGDIKHFYKVKVVAGAEKKAPVQTAGSAGMMILPAAAILGLGGLVAGLARRKKD